MYGAVFKPQSGKLLQKVSGTTVYLSFAPFLKYRCTQRLHSQKKEHESPRSAGKLRVPSLSIKKPFHYAAIEGLPFENKCAAKVFGLSSADYKAASILCRHIAKKTKKNNQSVSSSAFTCSSVSATDENGIAMSVNCQPLFLTETGKSFF